MGDDADLAVAIADRELTRSIAAARVTIAAGEPGICESCDEAMPRLVAGRCAFCRDGRRR